MAKKKLNIDQRFIISLPFTLTCYIRINGTVIFRFFSQGEERYIRASLAPDSMRCNTTKENGYPKRSCVLQKCKDCGPLVNHEIETYVSEDAHIIQFKTYIK